MKYRIKGANRSTGKDQVIEVEAASQDEAIKTAGTAILIESVQDITPKPIDYAGLKADLAPVLPPPSAPPPKPAWTPSAGGSLGHLLLGLLGMLMVLAGLGGLIEAGLRKPPPDTYLSSRDRFPDDNAIGATANTLERMERVLKGSESVRNHIPSTIGFGATMVSGCLLLILRALLRIDERLELRFKT